jgi:transposase-like protein
MARPVNSLDRAIDRSASFASNAGRSIFAIGSVLVVAAYFCESRVRRLDQTGWPYLMIDARYEKVRVEGRVISQAVLVGFASDGRREVLQWPEHHRRKRSSTNLLENGMKRLKKRTRVAGVFPSAASCGRLIGAQLLELHDQWQTEQRPYFSMSPGHFFCLSVLSPSL